MSDDYIGWPVSVSLSLSVQTNGRNWSLWWWSRKANERDGAKMVVRLPVSKRFIKNRVRWKQKAARRLKYTVDVEAKWITARALLLKRHKNFVTIFTEAIILLMKILPKFDFFSFCFFLLLWIHQFRGCFAHARQSHRRANCFCLLSHF